MQKSRFIELCPVTAIADDVARSIYFDPENETRSIIIWQRHGEIAAFANACPHLGPPLEMFPDRLLNQDRSHLICSAHGARFDFLGYCDYGPCEKKSLPTLQLIHRADGMLLLDRHDPVFVALWPTDAAHE